MRKWITALLRTNAFSRNWSLLVISGLLCQVLGVLATYRIARLLAATGYGEYNLVQATGSLAAVFAALGLNRVITRRCARAPEETGIVLAISIAMRTVALLISAIGIVVYERFFGGPLGLPYTCAAIVLLVALNLWDSHEAVAFGHEQMQYSATINLSGNILWLVAAWAVPASWITALSVSLSFVVLQLIEAIAYIIVAARRGWLRLPRYRPGEVRRISRALLSDAAPFWWLLLLSTATSQFPILVLGARSGFADVGLYNAANRLTGPLQLLMSTGLASLYPGLSRLGQRDHMRLASIVSRALMTIAALGSIGALAISLLRRELIAVLFSEKFAGAADVVAIQCWSTVLASTFSLIGTTLAAVDRQRLLAVLSTCYTLVALPILWIGAGRGASALAVAVLVAALLNATYHWVALIRALNAPLSRRALPSAALCLAIGMAVSYLVPPATPFIIRLSLVVLLALALLVGAARLGIERARAVSPTISASS